jgi:hypothetical protein
MSGIVSTIEGLANTMTTKAMSILDSVFPPERRQELLTKLQQFAIKNPKLSVCAISMQTFGHPTNKYARPSSSPTSP